jgi:Cu(I)/Ag(I) efflux system membrane fusion protein
MMENNLIKAIRYRIWLFGCWLAEIMYPVARRMSVRARKQLALGILVVAVGAPVNYYLFSSWDKFDAVAADEGNIPLLSEVSGNGGDAQANAGGETALEHAEKHMDTNYVCPMHPEIVTSDPEATCPICGMDLVVLENNGDADVVEISPTVINNLGVRINEVRRRNIYRSIDTVGNITFDEDKIRMISLRTPGWIEKQYVKSVGDRVEKGQLLFEVYSPELVNAQEEYVQALELDSGTGMIAASEDRLRSLGISEQQIEQLANDRKVNQLVQVYAPQNGVVSELHIRQGMHVKPATPTVSLVDLSSVWLIANVFESQVDWVKQGQMAEARLPFMPDKLWEGEVEYLYPSLDPTTRSLKARLRFDNIDEALKPNMYADVTIFASPKRKVLTVPREAVIRTGNQARVIVSLGDGKFKPVIIHAGTETEDLVEVVGGLEEGQEVVVSSQFLIDSESSMRAALLRMVGG